jgi:Tfp pilus assembly protein PilX
MTPETHKPPRGAPPEHGAALILTLLVIVLLVVIVTGFLSTTRVEQMASRNYSFQSQARQMAMLGVQRAVAQMNLALTNFAAATNVVSQPGRIIVDGTTNLLSSAALTGVSSSNVNLNESGIIHTNTNASLFRAPLFNVTNSTGQTNGRYAFWIDDEGSKANLNAMLSGPRGSFYPTNARSFDYSAVGSAGQAAFGAAISGSVSNNWPFFFSGNQIGLLGGVGAATAREYLHFMAGGAPNLTNLPRFMTNGRVNLNTFMGPVTNGAVVFQRNFLTNAAAATVLSDIDAVISNSIDRAAVTNRFGSSFTGKYTTNVLRQIVANINDWPLAAGSTNFPSGLTGAVLTNSDGIPTNFLGLRPYLHLNEIAALSLYRTNPSEVIAEIRITVEIVNPYNFSLGGGAMLVIDIATNSFTGSYLNGAGASAVLPTVTTNVLFSTNLTASLGPGLYTNVTLIVSNKYPMQPAYSNVSMTNSVVIKTVKLLQTTNSPLTIRDWAAANDFPTGGWSFTNTNAAIVYPPTWTNSAEIQGIAKNDPRVRRFAWGPTNAWLPVGGAGGSVVTILSDNSVTSFSSAAGVPGVLGTNDLAPGGSPSANLSLVRGFNSTTDANSSYRSLMDLGRIHTGLPWRTLQIRYQNAGETSIPDWALLDAFFISNNSSKLNVNSLQQPATTGVMSNASAQMAGGLLRTRSLASLFSAGTSANATASGLSVNSAFGTGVNSTLSVATNVAAMNFRTSWANRRSTNAAFSSNAYGLIGEVLEISNVADFSATDDFINEGRAAALIDALSTSSDVFSIYSVGFAVDGLGENVAEYRARASVRMDPTTGKFRVELMEPMVLP